MGDEKKKSFFQSQWDGWKAKALYDFVKFAVGAALLSYFGPAVFTGPKLISAVYLFVALIGLYLMVGAFLFRKKVQQYDPRLAAAMLRIDAEAILQRYKELDFDHREEARLPMHGSSWPDFGHPWNYVQMSLCSNCRMMTVLIVKVRVFWAQMEFSDEPKLFSVNDQSRLYQVIEALEDFNRRTAAMTKEE